MKYLEDKQHYIDRYDLLTIKDCIYWTRSMFDNLPKMMKAPSLQEIPEKKRETDYRRMMNMVIHSKKVERFKNKKEVIEKWMKDDEEKQNKLDNTQPDEIYCHECSVLMDVLDKSLHDPLDEPMRVLFIYKCPRCKGKQAHYDDGEKFKKKPTLCEKCGSEVDIDLKINKKTDVTTWTHKCRGCDYKLVEKDDHKKWEKEQKDKKAYEKKLLVKFKDEYCFNKKEGFEAVLHAEQVKNLVDGWKEEDKKKKDPLYQKVRSFKTLKVIEVNKLLKKALAKQGYSGLEFEKPEMGRFVAVPFVVQDSKIDREEYDSKQVLKKLVIKTLENTNWRLMSDGISYRIGYLSGRLRCYEEEEDLVSITKKKS